MGGRFILVHEYGSRVVPRGPAQLQEADAFRMFQTCQERDLIVEPADS